MKKVLVLIAIFSALIISGCTQNNYFTIKSKEFTDEQNEILSLPDKIKALIDENLIPSDFTEESIAE